MKKHLFNLLFIFLVLLVIAGCGNDDRYIIHDDGTVADNKTSLMWQREDDNITRSWQAAIDYCENLPLSTYSDWRLPTDGELGSIVDNSQEYPSIDSTVFPNTKSSPLYITAF